LIGLDDLDPIVRIAEQALPQPVDDSYMYTGDGSSPKFNTDPVRLSMVEHSLESFAGGHGNALSSSP
jgi:hypothetical protein